jgi:hypothetical protein
MREEERGAHQGLFKSITLKHAERKSFWFEKFKQTYSISLFLSLPLTLSHTQSLLLLTA